MEGGKYVSYAIPTMHQILYISCVHPSTYAEYMCVHACVHVILCVCDLCVSMHAMCACVCALAHAYVCAYSTCMCILNMHVHLCVCVCVRACVCVCVCGKS